MSTTPCLRHSFCRAALVRRHRVAFTAAKWWAIITVEAAVATSWLWWWAL